MQRLGRYVYFALLATPLLCVSKVAHAHGEELVFEIAFAQLAVFWFAAVLLHGLKKQRLLTAVYFFCSYLFGLFLAVAISWATWKILHFIYGEVWAGIRSTDDMLGIILTALCPAACIYIAYRRRARLHSPEN